tara:strand:- start:5394 stop:5774 length:381 start_codon:yes stop_codon:yes gene_type:complete
MIIINGTGRLGKDAELIEVKSGKILKFSLASNSLGSKDKQTTTWLDCVILNENRATSLVKFFTKGTGVVFTGELKSNNYEDKEGNKRVSYSCLFNQFEFIPSGNNDSNKEKSNIKKDPEFDDEIPF